MINQIKRFVIGACLLISVVAGVSPPPAYADNLKAQQVEFLLSQVRNTTGSLVSGTVTFYAAGTTTLKTVWSDRDKATPAANPYTLDANGTAQLYADGLYKVLIKNAAGTTVYTRDNLQFTPDATNNDYYADPSAADQGATTNSRSIASLLAAIGTSKQATIVLAHSGSGNTTTYTVGQNADWSAYVNVMIRIERGAVLSGAFTVTFPTDPYAGRYQIFASSVVVAGLRKSYPEWFGDDIKKAVDSLLSAGGEVVFQAKSYRSPYTSGSPMSKSGITFRGAGKPRFNNGYTALEGGTIIIGPLFWGANGVTFEDLGIDSGSAVVGMYYAGTAQEGLVSSGSWHSNNIKGVSVLCTSAFSDVHAMLFEGQTGGNISNISTVYGGAGLVIKGTHINVNGVYARSHYKYSILAKSDAGGLCDSINFSDVNIDTVGDPSGMIPGQGANWDTEGFVLLPVLSGVNQYPVTNITLNNAVIKNTLSGIDFDTTAGNFVGAIDGVTINNVLINNTFFAGVFIGENSKNAKLSNIILDTSEYGVLNNGDNILFNNVTSTNSGHNCFVNSGENAIFSGCKADNPYSINYFGFVNDGGSSIVRSPQYGSGITTNKASNISGTQTIEDISALNSKTDTIARYMRKQLINDIESISGIGSIVSAWLGVPDSLSYTMPDYSTAGTHTATFRNSALAQAFPAAPAQLGMANSMYYDSAHLWDAEDANDFSFGDGTTDSAFSVMVLGNIIDTTGGNLLAKYNSTTVSPQREWGLLWHSSGGLYFTLYDNSTGGIISRRYNAALSPTYVGVWTTYTGTYSGSKTAAGILAYIDNTQVLNQDLSSGSYTAMENTTAKVGVYGISAAGAVEGPLTAYVAAQLVFNINLTPANISAIRALLVSYFDL